MRPRNLLATLIIVIVVGLIVAVVYFQTQKTVPPATAVADSSPTPVATQLPPATASTTPLSSPIPPGASPVAVQPQQRTSAPDLTTDANGLSKATVIMNTDKGVIKFKFYPKDAPNTVNRVIQLINQGFYNGLAFHRVVPGFVIQGGDPRGDGTGGSGQHLKAEFNDRHHVEGTVAMARAADPDSADSQFYIALSTLPHLDRSYTVFGQVIEGMDNVRKIQKGDKIVSLTID